MESGYRYTYKNNFKNNSGTIKHYSILSLSTVFLVAKIQSWERFFILQIKIIYIDSLLQFSHYILSIHMLKVEDGTNRKFKTHTKFYLSIFWIQIINLSVSK